MNQYLFWGLMSIDLGALTQFSVHPSLPVPLTKNGPLRNLILCPTSIEQVGLIFNIVIFLILNLRQTRQSKKHKENKENRIKSFYYFCKDFVKLHGIVHHEDSFNGKGFSSRLNTINYEYVVRPWIVISKFWDTVLQNLDYLKDSKEIFEMESLNTFMKKVETFKEPLEVLNNKSGRPGRFQGVLFREKIFI